MAVSQLPQAPYRQDRRVYPTPDSGDVLFSQVKDCTRTEIPEYGTPHPDTKKWPDHKLVFVKPVDIERDGIFEFFYAADRDNQDQYNFSYSQGELVLTRTYIVSRDSLEDFVEPKLGQDDPDFPEYKFATQQVQRVEDKELDSLYVAVQRFYAKHNTTFAVDTETKTGYKIRRISTLNKELVETGNSSSSFNEKGWTNRQETVQITGGTVLTTIDQKPFVKVQSDTTISGTPVVPETGTGSSRLVYDNGETKVYENVNDTSTPKTGPAGVEKESRPYAVLTTDKSYSTSNEVTSQTGASQVVFNDGETTVYEVSNVTATPRQQKVGEEKEERPYASLSTAKRYSVNGEVATNTGSSNIVWTDGTTTIYEVNEITASAKAANVGQEKEERPYASLKTEKRYSTSGNVSTKTGSSNVVWTDGLITIYEVNEITATAKPATVGEEKEERPYASLKTQKRYATNGNVSTKTGSSNVVWTDGLITIYEVNEITATAKPATVGEEKEERPYASLKTEKRYSTNGNVSTKTGSSNVVWTDGSVIIYEINEVTATAKQEEVGEEKEVRPYVKLVTKKRYSTNSDIGTETGSSNVVWTDGETTIYELSEITPEPKLKEYGSEFRTEPWGKYKIRKEYIDTLDEGNTKLNQQNIIWTDGEHNIFEKSEFEITEANSDNYISEKSLRDGPYIEKTQTSYIKATSAESIDSDEDYYTVTEVFNDGNQKVFRLDERILENNPLEWEEIINYEWPSVLEDIRFVPWTSKINGQATYYPRIDYKQGFSGPQKATKKQYWQKEKPDITPPELMVPKGISYRSPMLSLDIPPCLHSTFEIDVTNGTSDPDWEYTLDVETYEATEPADWPDEIKWTESIPLKGGYLVTETTIRKPAIG